MLSRMGPRTSSFPVRSLSVLILAAIAAFASGCVGYSRPYGHHGGYGGSGGYGYGGCRSGCGGYGYGSSGVRRYQTIYVPVYQDTHHHHPYDGRSRHGQRGWADDDRRDRDHGSHRDRKGNRGPQRDRNEDRRVGPPPQQQPQMPQRQRIAPQRAESQRTRALGTREEWRSERARRGEPASSRGGNAWRAARERP